MNGFSGTRSFVARMIMHALDVAKYHSDGSYRKEIQELIWEAGVGGLIIFNGTISATRAAVDALQTNAHWPLSVACDLEPGLGNRLTDSTSFPHAMAIGRTDAESCRRIARAIGEEARAAGIGITFAPVCDVNCNPHNPIVNVRAFGESVEQVSEFARAFIQGTHAAGVRAVIKHFPGHGDTSVDSHLELPLVSRSLPQLQRLELPPFVDCLSEGGDGVMVGHILATALDTAFPATLSRAWIQYLRNEMHFDGAIFTDALLMHAITKKFSPEKSAVCAMKAGCDVLVMPEDTQKAIEGLQQSYNDEVATRALVKLSHKRIEQLVGNSQRISVDSQEGTNFEKLGIEVATKAIEVKGDASRLGISDGSYFLLFAGGNDLQQAQVFEKILTKWSAQSKTPIYVEINTSNLLINKYDKGYCLMFGGVAGFQGNLGDAQKFREGLPLFNEKVTEKIGISVGNPYIWSELSEMAIFSCKVSTYSNSFASLNGLIALLSKEYSDFS